MKHKFSGAGFLVFLIMAGVIIVIAAELSARSQKCSYPGCDSYHEPNNEYCYIHWRQSCGGSSNSSSTSSSSSSGSSGSSSSQTGSSSSSGSSGSSSGNSSTYSSSSSGKTSSSSSMDSYDDGYNAIYEDDDYDWDRYWSDDDYAAGVDDAMEDEDW